MWQTIPKCPRHSGYSLSWRMSRLVSNLLHHFDQDERETDGAVPLRYDKTKIVERIPGKMALRSLQNPSGWIISTKEANKVRFESCETYQGSLAYIRAIQGHLGGEAISPEMMGHVLLPKGWKVFIYHKGCYFNMKSILQHGLVAGGKRSNEGRKTVFFSPLFIATRWWRRTTSRRYDSSKEGSLLQQMKTWSRCGILGKIVTSTRSWIAILADEVKCHHCVPNCACWMYLQGNPQKPYQAYMWNVIWSPTSTGGSSQKPLAGTVAAFWTELWATRSTKLSRRSSDDNLNL